MTTWPSRSQRWLRRAAYRVQQFLTSLRPQVAVQEYAVAAAQLPEPAMALFQRMPRRDQRHSLNVLRRVQQAAPDQPDLQAAALLHDAGKTGQPGRRVRLRHRVLAVLMEAVRSGSVQRVASDNPHSWRYPFYLHLHHPELGASMAEQAGCSALTVELIRRHQEKLNHAPRDKTEHLLVVLQAADDES